MGHVHRALTLAHEITKHEVRFVCNQKSWVVVNQLMGYDYWLGVYNDDEIEDKILELRPDLVGISTKKNSLFQTCGP
jgi:spore coat polysaccharide biosynthesis predicted glycosyltransferase SpsG